MQGAEHERGAYNAGVFPPNLRKYLLWIGVPVLLVGLYALAGFWLVPRLVRSNLLSFVSENYHRQLTVGEVRCNPFTLTLEVRDLSLPDADAQPLLSFGRLFVDLDVASIWRRGPSFAAIALDDPYARVLIRTGGVLNLSDLAKPFANEPAPAKPAGTKPMRLFVDRLTVRRGRSIFEDQTRPQPFRADLRPITFDLRNFSTTQSTDNNYSLEGASAAGERFAWSGMIRLVPLVSHGKFELSDVQVHTLWSYLSDSVQFETTSGVLGLSGDYDLDTTGGGPGIKAKVHDLVVTDLGLRPKGADANSVDLKRIEVHETSLDADRHAVAIGKVELAGGEVRAWLDAHGRLNLLDLAGPAPASEGASTNGQGAAPPPSPPPAPKVESSGSAQAAWTVAVPDISVSALKIGLEDRQVSPAAVFVVNPLNVHVGGYTTAPDVTLDVTADAAINDGGKLVASGNVSPSSGAVSADVELSKLDLTAFQPYLTKQTQLKLLSGQLGTKLRINRAADGALTVEGDTDVVRVRTIDNDLEQDFVKWDRLRVQKMRFASMPASLQISSIVADAPYARVIIAKDRTVNISEALSPSGAAPAVAPAADPPTPKAATSKGRNHAKRSASAPEKPSAATSATPFPISIGTVRIVNGSANFADLWIQPNFAVGIQTLNGSISGLSSRSDSRAKVQLEGKVDRYAPVVISGDVNVFSATAYSDVKMSFKGVEMTTATPYSGHFAGYKIEKGKLSVDLNYHIQNRELQADHRFVIDQLQLGERVESPDAVHLPLQLAVALLKDRNGVIDVNLPVTGSLDDPQFRIGPIIWKAVLNLLTKVATAPFALLGRLFGGGDEMNLIDFAPGSAALDAAAQQHLAALVKSLQERPQLQLDVPMVYSPELDKPVLATKKLQDALLNIKREEPARKGAASAQIDATVLDDPAEHYRLLVALYREKLGKQAPLPPLSQAIEAAGKKKSDVTALQPAIDELAAAVGPKLEVSESDLEALGKQRSQAIQDALLASGEVEATRVFVITSDPKPPQGNVVRAELALK